MFPSLLLCDHECTALEPNLLTPSYQSKYKRAVCPHPEGSWEFQAAVKLLALLEPCPLALFCCIPAITAEREACLRFVWPGLWNRNRHWSRRVGVGPGRKI